MEFEGVPSSNNHAEREVRPAVLMRKASYGNQSERGAATRAVLMSVCRTLKNRGLDPPANDPRRPADLRDNRDLTPTAGEDQFRRLKGYGCRTYGRRIGRL